MKKEIISEWRMKRADGEKIYDCGTLPVSVYQTLIKNGEIDNPYYGEREAEMRELSEHDYGFMTEFETDRETLSHEKVFLRFYGIDTLGEVFLNGKSLGEVDNMHRTYEFDVKDTLKIGKNALLVALKSPIVYCEKEYEKRKIYGVGTTVAGFPYIRKTVFTMGWDWGPQMPDLGIWRGLELIAADTARIDGVYAVQRFDENYSALKLSAEISLQRFSAKSLSVKAELTLSSGKTLTKTAEITDKTTVSFDINNPELWYPRGYGKQPLNTLKITLLDGEKALDESVQTVGFREMTISRNDEQHEFCYIVNGLKIFAMGANYVPEDQIMPFITEEKIVKLLDDCEAANYNTVRIWGGGNYPCDFFMDECDRRGIIVWQEFMFACSAQLLTDKIRATIIPEFIDNIKRLRSHPSMILWCGNNEVESMWEGWGVPEDDEARESYVEIFERILPKLCREYDPERFYWPSSPSSGGSLYGTDGTFHNSSATDKGDQHYWEIWHSFKPIEEFRKYLFPFCSEYGFESVPEMKTIMSIAEKEDLNLCCPVMEAHQKCIAGNEKLMYYIAQMCRYPYDFESFIYASQLVQSDCIRSNVEHLRRNRGRCMGSIYWQVNDTNPIISWASIDSFGRWKGLHYAARRFYAPVMVSCLEENAAAVSLNVTNERVYPVKGLLSWALRDNCGNIVKSGEETAEIAPLSSRDVCVLDLTDKLSDEKKKREYYLEYSFKSETDPVSKGTAIFVRPKTFDFKKPNVAVTIDESAESFTLTFTAETFAKAVCLTLEKADCVFSDNWFDINGEGDSVSIMIEKARLTEKLTAAELKKQLKIFTCYDLQVSR